jgi:endo-1,4-beta-xylanase
MRAPKALLFEHGRSRVRALGTVAAGIAAILAIAGGVARADSGHSNNGPSDSLRSLAAPIGLRIGTAIIPFDLDHPDYAQIAADQFSSVTPGNEMKWETVEPTRGTYDWSGGDRLVRFAQQHGQLVRGHTLVWHNQLPSWLTQGVGDGTISNAELRDLLRKHIVDEVSHFRGKIWQWDVANEFFANAWDPNPLPDGINGDDFWVQHLGEGILADAFRWAHQADPHALLFYNDFNIGGEDGDNKKADAAYNWVKKMLAQGVPIDGIGNQGHLDTQYGFPTMLQADLQRYADLGLKVAITEADVRTFVDGPDTQVPTQALEFPAHTQYYDAMLKACLMVRSCISFTVWGFGDADSWVPGFFTGEGYAGIYDVNLQPKAAYFTMQDDLELGAHGAPHRTGDGRH